MNATEATAAITSAIATIAPEVDTSVIDLDAPFRSEMDLDSLDFLNLVQALHESTGVDIPEADYPKVDTLARLTSYLTEHG